MKKQGKNPEVPDSLRKKAEEQLKSKQTKTSLTFSETDMLKLIHELEVHQIELEMQNEELVLAKEKAELAEEKYTELYDFAPSGYFTLSRQGKILGMNLRSAQMIGKERSFLINSQLEFCIKEDSRGIFTKFLEDIFLGKGQANCELPILSANNNDLYVHFTGIISENKEQCYVTVTDITERKKAEEELKKNLAKYEVLINTFPIGITLSDKEGNIVETNEKALELLGLRRKEHLKRKIKGEEWKIIKCDGTEFPQDEYPSVKAMKENRLVENVEMGIVKSTKDITWINVTAAPIPIEDFGVVIAYNDISERKQLEEKIQRNREKLKALIDVSPTGIWTTDKFGNNTYVSPRWSLITGISPEEAKGTGWTRGLHPDDRELIMNDWKRIDTSDKPKTYDFRFIRPDGDIVWVLSQATVVKDNDGNVIEWIGTIIDITERKLLENALSENEERMRLALKATNDVVWDWDIVNDTQRWNEAGTRVFGWTEIVENPVNAAWWMERIHPDDRQRIDKGFFAAVKNNNGAQWQDEYRFLKADGTYAEVLDRGYILRNNRGNAIRMIGAMLDITQRKKIENELRESELFAHTIANTTPALLFLFDFDQAKNIWTNELHKRFFEDIKKDSADFDFSDISQFTHPDDFRELMKLTDEMLKNTDINHYEIDHRLKWKSTWKWMKLLVSVFKRNNNGKPIQILGAIVDIDDQKKIEKDLLEAKQKIEESERLFKSLINNAPDGIVIIDGQGKFKYASPTAARLFGYNENEVMGHSGDEFTHPDDLPLISKTLETIINNPSQKSKIEYRFRKRDGEYRWIETTFSNLLSDHAINGFILNFSDVTVRKQIFEDLILAKEKAEESEARFRSLMEGIDSIAVQGYDPDGITRFWNKASEKLYGYSQQEAIGTNLLDLIIPPEMKDEVAKAIHEMAVSGEAIPSGELVLKHKNGSPVQVISNHAIVNVPGQTQELFCLDIDIAKRKKTEEALRITKELLNASQRLSKTGGWEWNNQTKAMYWTDETYRIHDMAPGDIEPGSAEHINLSTGCYRPEDRPVILSAFQACLKKGIPYDLEFPFTSVKGRQLWIRTSAKLLSEKGKAVRVIGNIIDITDSKLAEIELKRSKELLRDLYKRIESMRENERADISREIHDQLGQSLTALKIDLMGLRDKPNTEPKEGKLLENMIKMVNTVSKDVQRISSELRPLMLDDLGLAATLEWYCEEFADRTRLSVELDIVPVQTGNINKDLALYRVAQESLTNIIRHANAGIVHVSLNKTNDSLVLTIQDDGIGISPDKINSFKSLGLLGMSERVRQYDGKLEILSPNNKGTIIQASIPIN
jgi:PAS domain S-box-containing protein